MRCRCSVCQLTCISFETLSLCTIKLPWLKVTWLDIETWAVNHLPAESNVNKMQSTFGERTGASFQLKMVKIKDFSLCSPVRLQWLSASDVCCSKKLALENEAKFKGSLNGLTLCATHKVFEFSIIFHMSRYFVFAVLFVRQREWFTAYMLIT